LFGCLDGAAVGFFLRAVAHGVLGRGALKINLRL
jgi:hypothetical protein